MVISDKRCLGPKAVVEEKWPEIAPFMLGLGLLFSFFLPLRRCTGCCGIHMFDNLSGIDQWHSKPIVSNWVSLNI